MRTTQFSGRLYRGGGYVSLWVKMGVYQPPFTTTPFHPLCTECSVLNRSGIIAQHGVSNAKPSMVDLILRLPETNFQ